MIPEYGGRKVMKVSVIMMVCKGRVEMLGGMWWIDGLFWESIVRLEL